MDFANPKTWTDGINVVLNAPHIVVPLILVVGAAVWWFRGTTLKEQIEALKAQMTAKDERLQLAQDQQASVTDQLETVRAEVNILQTKVSQTPAPLRSVAEEATANAVRAVEGLTTANTALTRTLSTKFDYSSWRSARYEVTVEYEDGKRLRTWIQNSIPPKDESEMDRAIIWLQIRDQQAAGHLPVGSIKSWKFVIPRLPKPIWDVDDHVGNWRLADKK